MSILLVEVVPQGLIFGADRNITEQIVEQGRLSLHHYVGQSQRPKVLRWPQRRALVGYVGEAEIGGLPADEWLYDFIGDHLDFSTFEELSESLRSQVQAQRMIDEGGAEARPLILHLGGFEQRRSHQVPVVWYIRNAYRLDDQGYGDVRKEFQHSEEFWRYFPDLSPAGIRHRLEEQASRYDPFWFHHGSDLGTFNSLDAFLKAAFRFLCESHDDHSLPGELADWERQVRMAILTYGSYFQAFKRPWEQSVGGGADVVSIPWPEQ